MLNRTRAQGELSKGKPKKKNWGKPSGGTDFILRFYRARKGNVNLRALFFRRSNFAEN